MSFLVLRGFIKARAFFDEQLFVHGLYSYADVSQIPFTFGSQVQDAPVTKLGRECHATCIDFSLKRSTC